MEQQTPIPPLPQIKDEAVRRAKTRHFLILDLGGGGRDLGFPFILSKIVASSSIILALITRFKEQITSTQAAWFFLSSGE